MSRAVVEEAPEADQIEVSVFGRGMGECVLCHLGNRRWLMVDSFRDDAKNPVANAYLEQLEGKHRIVAVVATHWDDDHTHGMADVVARHEPDEVWMPVVLNDRQVFRFAIEHNEAMRGRAPSGLRNFAQVLERTHGQRTRRWGIAGRQLVTGTDTVARLLAPTDQTVDAALAALGIQLEAGFGEIASVSSNSTSIVLWISNGSRCALLGADLEASDEGWSAVLHAGAPADSLASVIKVPHHGSATADEGRIWSELATSTPVNAVTRYTRLADPLPRQQDIDRLNQRGGDVYIAGGIPERFRPVRDEFDLHLDATSIGGLRPAYGPAGLIRTRSAAGSDGWEVNCFGEVEFTRGAGAASR